MCYSDVFVSVVMPVFNCSLFINEAIDSILNQTHKNFELLILDDCSTDGTISKLKTYRDNRIQIYTSAFNKGQAYQLNKGLSLARGKYVAIAHADDINVSTRLEKQISFLEENPGIDIVGGWIKLINSTEKIIRHPYSPAECLVNLFFDSPLPHPLFTFRRDSIIYNKISYRQNFVPAEDYHFLVNLSRYSKISNIQEILLLYRIHENQISIKKSDFLLEKKRRIQELYANYHFKDVNNSYKVTLLKIASFQSTDLLSSLDIRNIYFFKKKLDKQSDLSHIWHEKMDNILSEILIVTKKYTPGVFWHILFLFPGVFFSLSFLNKIRLIHRSLISLFKRHGSTFQISV